MVGFHFPQGGDLTPLPPPHENENVGQIRNLYGTACNPSYRAANDRRQHGQIARPRCFHQCVERAIRPRCRCTSQESTFPRGNLVYQIDDILSPGRQSGEPNSAFRQSLQKDLFAGAQSPPAAPDPSTSEPRPGHRPIDLVHRRPETSGVPGTISSSGPEHSHPTPRGSSAPRCHHRTSRQMTPRYRIRTVPGPGQQVTRSEPPRKGAANVHSGHEMARATASPPDPSGASIRTGQEPAAPNFDRRPEAPSRLRIGRRAAEASPSPDLGAYGRRRPSIRWRRCPTTPFE